MTMAEITAGGALTRPKASSPQGQTHMVTVAKTAGVSPFAQMMQMMALQWCERSRLLACARSIQRRRREL